MLAELQLRLGLAFDERGEEGAAARWVLDELRPLARISAAESLAVYQDATRRVISAALHEIFPVCAELVGAGCFERISECYARAHASTSPDLARVGDRLPGFLPGLAFLDGVPYLGDVAALELARHRAFRAAEPPASVDALRLADAISQAPEAWRFSLPGSAQLLTSRYPVLAIWQAHQGRQDELPSIDLESDVQGDRLIVWRRGRDICVHRVDAALWPVLSAIEAGASAAEMLRLGGPDPDLPGEELGEQPPEDYAWILGTLEVLFSRGWIAGGEPIPPDSSVGHRKEER